MKAQKSAPAQRFVAVFSNGTIATVARLEPPPIGGVTRFEITRSGPILPGERRSYDRWIEDIRDEMSRVSGREIHLAFV